MLVGEDVVVGVAVLLVLVGVAVEVGEAVVVELVVDVGEDVEVGLEVEVGDSVGVGELVLVGEDVGLHSLTVKVTVAYASTLAFVSWYVNV